MRCASCMYWKPLEYPKDEGKCRRYPPGRQEGRGYKYGLYPITTEDTWCGEYKMCHAVLTEELEAAGLTDYPGP